MKRYEDVNQEAKAKKQKAKPTRPEFVLYTYINNGFKMEVKQLEDNFELVIWDYSTNDKLLVLEDTNRASLVLEYDLYKHYIDEEEIHPSKFTTLTESKVVFRGKQNGNK